ncbi:MAG: hypothetical protein J6T10_15380 [Methanobrevibacter sp.]|nr:hypothetical protein [Methanobrevibacter sp.]
MKTTKWYLTIDYDKFKKQFDNMYDSLQNDWFVEYGKGHIDKANEITARMRGMQEVMSLLLVDESRFALLDIDEVIESEKGSEPDEENVH